MAVLALEGAPGPISIYDIERFLVAEFGWAPARASLNATVAQDRRCCWAGRGIYGLWRHGVCPGPRRLLDVVSVVLDARPSTSMLELPFVLRHIGYRFQPATLDNVIRQWTSDTQWPSGANGDPSQRLADRLKLPPDAVEVITRRIRRQTRDAVRERRRRLSNDRGLADADEVYSEGRVVAAGPYG